VNSPNGSITDLSLLEKRSITIIREAKAQFSKPAVLWSTGKDSTATLWLCRKAFFGQIPFPVIHIDTGYKFPEIYEFRDKVTADWGLGLVIARNMRALDNGVSPEAGRLDCCTLLKTEALKALVRKEGFDALILVKPAVKSTSLGECHTLLTIFISRFSVIRSSISRQV
jgi:sulfate adenylyltransferase subunit 2